MKRILYLLAIILMATSTMMAQDKKSFTLEDLLPGGNNYFINRRTSKVSVGGATGC